MRTKATASGIDRIATGNIFVASTISWNACRPRNVNRASAYPAGAPRTRASTIVTTATTTLLMTEANTPVDWRKSSIVAVEKLVGSSGLG